MLGDRDEKWWLVISANTGIAKYYRHLFHIHRYWCEQLRRPAWEEHITILRNEEPTNKELWKKYEGQLVDFDIVLEPRTNGYYFWLPVICQQALDLRTELGITVPMRWDFHLSFGHRNEETNE